MNDVERQNYERIDELNAKFSSLRQELEMLKVQYKERGMAMRETGDIVRSLYEPKMKVLVRALRTCIRDLQSLTNVKETKWANLAETCRQEALQAIHDVGY